MTNDTGWLTKYRAFNDVLQRRLAMQEKENNDRAALRAVDSSVSDVQLARLLRHRIEHIATLLRETPIQSGITRTDMVNELADIADVIDERLNRPAR